MEFLLHNPLAEMYGPLFLIVYGVVIAITLVICYRRVHYYVDNTQGLLPIPAQPDPYEIAFLRGGENEVARLAIFTLMQQGYLQTQGDKEKRLHSALLYDNFSGFSPIEADTLQYFDVPRSSKEIFSSSLLRQIKAHCDPYAEQLTRSGLLSTEDTRTYALTIGFKGTLVIWGLGSYKLFAAVSNGHNNVMLLVVMGILALPGLLLVCQTPRVTALGQRYLERLRLAFAGLKTSSQRSEQDKSMQGVQSEDGREDVVPLAAAVFGMSLLTASMYPDFYSMFRLSTQTGSAGGGCGTVVGCGSASSSSSGGDGGGDGGGGCGGGGCGGGCGGCGGG